MTELERITKVVDWLIFEKIVDSRRDMAIKLRYKETYISQILNEKKPINSKFIKRLAILDDRINFEWIGSGKGDMLKEHSELPSVVSEPLEEYIKRNIPYELYKLTLENEKLSKEKELELIKQNGQLIEMLKKAYGK